MNNKHLSWYKEINNNFIIASRACFLHPILIDDIYSLGKDKAGNVFAKFVGAQSGVKKRTIWVAKPIVTNLLGPNLVGDQLAQTWSIGVVGGHWRLGYIMKI